VDAASEPTGNRTFTQTTARTASRPSHSTAIGLYTTRAGAEYCGLYPSPKKICYSSGYVNFLLSDCFY